MKRLAGKKYSLYILTLRSSVDQLGHSLTIIGNEATQELHIQILLDARHTVIPKTKLNYRRAPRSDGKRTNPIDVVQPMITLIIFWWVTLWPVNKLKSSANGRVIWRRPRWLTPFESLKLSSFSRIRLKQARKIIGLLGTGVILKNPLLKTEVFRLPVLSENRPIKLRININKIEKYLGRKFKPLQGNLNESVADRAKGICKVKKRSMQHFLFHPHIIQQLL
jgi:hypothetical protein